MGCGKSKIKPDSYKKQQPVINEKDSQLIDMKLCRDSLAERRNQLYKFIDAERKKAIDFHKLGRKDQAISCMKRKMSMEQMVKVTSGYYDNVSKLIGELESSNVALEVVNVMEGANEILDVVLSDLDIDKIEALKERIEDKMEQVDGLSEAIGTLSGVPSDEEAEAELSKLDEINLSDFHIPKEPIKVPKESNTSSQNVIETEPPQQEMELALA
ncbi:Vacuolar protein sorting 20B (Vps20B) [Monocercomonoides exilis]|uniref:Vacuolar protein sorting 20B (Vps20B) n=1 Tax=Monocercomonoides exilis TaxID=2049356 RepID=UPI003559F242|nr:Vacuolar protein sorting 20B (Vps20B) [Monocercomonoides exilis]|eukprot:MONOS_1427.1-p1 / transcript=MONOS_1427.1 / gene=MONOS_1427 / organism=Monocercomonoides_exilis_PA203 / gene_product= Vacuolar protein sorting 20B (Vps20B) / transcript_product= Vacuolar protein sorting 20B (Vps20B) / location=Mono_scaffold00025:117175-118043(-) / protein_length=214 / sequence_SO=supercontig / SO=protein_coding / is_pseudo=false